jgi:hypothetical protein
MANSVVSHHKIRMKERPWMVEEYEDMELIQKTSKGALSSL